VRRVIELEMQAATTGKLLRLGGAWRLVLRSALVETEGGGEEEKCV